MHLKESQSESSRIRHGFALRFDTEEAAAILGMSRAQLYKRIKSGALRRQKDGTRTYITREELERYVQSCDDDSGAELPPTSAARVKPSDTWVRRNLRR